MRTAVDNRSTQGYLLIHSVLGLYIQRTFNNNSSGFSTKRTLIPTSKDFGEALSSFSSCQFLPAAKCRLVLKSPIQYSACTAASGATSSHDGLPGHVNTAGSLRLLPRLTGLRPTARPAHIIDHHTVSKGIITVGI